MKISSLFEGNLYLLTPKFSHILLILVSITDPLSRMQRNEVRGWRWLLDSSVGTLKVYNILFPLVTLKIILVNLSIYLDSMMPDTFTNRSC